MDTLADGQPSAPLREVVGELSRYLADVTADLFGKLTDADVLAELQEFESLRRRLAVVDHALVAELDRRALAGRLVVASTSTLLQAALRLSPHEAKQRVSASQVCGPRWSLTGERLESLLPEVAAGQAAGVVSVEQARVIAETLEELPGSVAPADVSAAERHLVVTAAHLPPRQVGIAGRRILAQLDPDGVLASDAEHARRRSFALMPQADGGYRAVGRLTPACGALLLSWLSPRSAPRPAQGMAGDPAQAIPDSRNHGQRMHDALQELAGLAVRRTELLDSGAPAQVIISMTADQLADRQGWAETSFGQLLTVGQALKLADEAAITLLVRDARGAVLRQGRTKRIATRSQTLALIARDGGCSFPGCDKPPEWCQRHHIVPWADGGTTDLDNLTLLCSSHHRDFEAAGWACRLVDGLPTWIPPGWVDPTRTPRWHHRIDRR
ncbi:HNH endonuclease signature motif containing protein [Jatrophihabitans sp.]|uniref:HNH endonuclease signature motif containing protein n=1 Tax=Jatrophihabitans sp. TaxID=1932789 RepID=UPI002BF45246|nr:DUF222 domain-containing protein [Jatrophihabitans sp.]